MLPAKLTGELPPQFDNQWYLALVNKWLDEVAKASGSVHTFAQVQLLRSVVRARLTSQLNALICVSRPGCVPRFAEPHVCPAARGHCS